MIVKVEQCWGGKDLYFRLTLPDGSRESIQKDTWDRKAATEARNLLENVYHLKRQNIRFQVH